MENFVFLNFIYLAKLRNFNCFRSLVIILNLDLSNLDISNLDLSNFDLSSNLTYQILTFQILTYQILTYCILTYQISTYRIWPIEWPFKVCIDCQGPELTLYWVTSDRKIKIHNFSVPYIYVSVCVFVCVCVCLLL